MKFSTKKASTDDDRNFMTAGQFWARAITNPALRRFAVSGHALLFVGMTLVAKLTADAFGVPANKYEAVRYILGGLSAVMGVFALILSATLARDIVKTGELRPSGYGGLAIDESTGAAVTCCLAAFIILFVLR